MLSDDDYLIPLVAIINDDFTGLCFIFVSLDRIQK